MDAQRRWDHRGEQRQDNSTALWAEVRARRNALLAACDWTQLTDMADPQRVRWQPYRQALRDITNQDDPSNINWPIVPNLKD